MFEVVLTRELGVLAMLKRGAKCFHSLKGGHSKFYRLEWGHKKCIGLGQYNRLGEYCCPHTASSVFRIVFLTNHETVKRSIHTNGFNTSIIHSFSNYSTLASHYLQ